MTDIKEQAAQLCGDLHQENRISYSDYLLLMDAIQEIDTISERDEELRILWEEFGDVPMNPETECMEDQFLEFPAGTHREEIWHWFDERHSKGVAYLLGFKESSP